MDLENKKTRSYRVIGIILLLLLVALFAGWLIGRSNNKTTTANSPSSSNASTATDIEASSDVKSIVSYMLPDGWKEDTCPNGKNIVYIIPNGSSLDCSANPSSPIKIFIDPQNTTDCQQLNNVGDVRKHVCISLYIDGHKSLKASTEYPESTSYKADTTVSDYYINTGKGVVKVEYMFTSDNSYQMGFDQFATSVKVK